MDIDLNGKLVSGMLVSSFPREQTAALSQTDGHVEMVGRNNEPDTGPSRG